MSAAPHGMDWRLLAAVFGVLGLGVSGLHGLQRVADVPDWVNGALIGGFGFMLLGIRNLLSRRGGAPDTE